MGSTPTECNQIFCTLYLFRNVNKNNKNIFIELNFVQCNVDQCIPPTEEEEDEELVKM